MRGVLARCCDIFPAIGASGALASARSWCGGRGSGIGGDRRRPVTGVPCAAAAAPVGFTSEGRGEKLPPRNGESPGEPQPPMAGHPGRSSPLDCSGPSRCPRPRPVRPGAPKVRP